MNQGIDIDVDYEHDYLTPEGVKDILTAATSSPAWRAGSIVQVVLYEDQRITWGIAHRNGKLIPASAFQKLFGRPLRPTESVLSVMWDQFGEADCEDTALVVFRSTPSGEYEWEAGVPS